MNIMTPDGIKIGGNAFLDLLINGAVVGTDGVGVIAMKKGVDPQSSPVDTIQQYVTSEPTSVYPPAHSTVYVKTTTQYNDTYTGWRATDPSRPLTGAYSNNCSWMTSGSDINQRFHIDLGSAKVITRIYYENTHDSGIDTNKGVKNFTFWGSNDVNSFNELTYSIDTGWTQITAAQSTFDQHVASDVVDPKYITVTNTTAYRYYAFKFADAYGAGSYMTVRRIELQVSEGFAELRVRDEAGNTTTLSPHNFNGIPNKIKQDLNRDSDGLGWTYHSEKNGKEITVDMFNAIRDLEALTGNKYIYSNPNANIQSMDTVRLQKIRDNIIPQVKPLN